jgi:class 3 adenylate cyclase
LGSISYDFSNLVMLGLAQARQAEFDCELLSLAVWDGKAGDGEGGTQSVTERMLNTLGRVFVLDPKNVVEDSRRSAQLLESHTTTRESLIPESQVTAIRAILFADVAGFSKLTEYQYPAFQTHFMGLVARVLKHFHPLVKNTWGDGLFLVFANPESAGDFALALRDEVRAHPWSDHGLPDDLGVRIGLHAGPGYIATDPITGGHNFLGSHVSFAARIEPATIKNEVFASRQFVAICWQMGVRSFRSEYAGIRTLPKLGPLPLWRIERAHA